MSTVLSSSSSVVDEPQPLSNKGKKKRKKKKKNKLQPDQSLLLATQNLFSTSTPASIHTLPHPAPPGMYVPYSGEVPKTKSQLSGQQRQAHKKNMAGRPQPQQSQLYSDLLFPVSESMIMQACLCEKIIM